MVLLDICILYEKLVLLDKVDFVRFIAGCCGEPRSIVVVGMDPWPHAIRVPVESPVFESPSKIKDTNIMKVERMWMLQPPYIYPQ